MRMRIPSIYICICSAQSGNLRNLEIALRILRILRLRSNLEIAHHSCAISTLRNYSIVRNLQIAQITYPRLAG